MFLIPTWIVADQFFFCNIWVGIHKMDQARVEPKNQLKFTTVYTKFELVVGLT